MIQARPYQQEAHDAVIEHWKRSTLPCVVEAATGAGKSVIVAMLAHTLHNLSGGKRVLCLAPGAELVTQNAEKYKAIGERCSIYSASAGSKSLRHQVVFATEGTFKSQAKRMGPDFAGVIVDECHRLTPTIKQIIEDMRSGNPNLRVCGLSATPYRLGYGFIFGVDPDGKAMPDTIARDPYFHQCVYAISARMLLSMGYLTPLRAADINAESYDTSGLKVKANGTFDPTSLKAAFEGWGRKTSAIIADVVAQTQAATGVMIFAATVQHAKEVMASLHPDNARLITGETSKTDRDKIIKDFKARKFLYLVNVSVLTTGFDAEHVSHIAILRATESVSLLQQIMGRGMRLCEGKAECVVLDYAGNIEKHMPDGDLYAPQIKAAYQSSGGGVIECLCEGCGRVNLFSARPNDSQYNVDEYGYFADLDGERITVQNHKGEAVPMPAHFGRRCQHVNLRSGERCDYYWSCKVCQVCEHANDIAARFCSGCKCELIDPASRLILEFEKAKKDPTTPQCEEVLKMDVARGISRSGNGMVTVTITTPRRTFPIYLLESTTWQANKKHAFERATRNFSYTPKSVQYKKSGDFWEVIGFDIPTDEEILSERIGSR
jgi:DNA repair protein RadD